MTPRRQQAGRGAAAGPGPAPAPRKRTSARLRNLPFPAVKVRRVRFGHVSTPTSIDLPDRVRPAWIRTDRGSFAALDARPVHGVCDREPALLVPGYTGSKEDFLAVL